MKLYKVEVMNKITIYWPSSHDTKEGSPFSSSRENRVVSVQELKTWVSSREIFSHLFSYKESELIVCDLRLISKPFLLTLLVWILSKNKAIRKDSKGNLERITLKLLFSLFYEALKGLFRKKKFLKQIEREINSILLAPIFPQKPDLSKPPVYLRADFCFGLQSGGSVGHIAGVLNNLKYFAGKPIFLTTDPIPTVDPQHEQHIIAPGNSFWDFSELPPLDFNRILYKKAIQLIGARQPSFIYQRYSINNFSGIQIARHYQVPFVLEFNGSEVWVTRHWGGGVLKYEALAAKIETLNQKACNLIVVVSHPLKNALIDKGIDSNKILVNPNAVDTERYSPAIDGSAIRERFHLHKKLVLGFIGTFGKWHGAEVLAEAFGLLLQNHPELKGEIHLTLIGDGMTMPLVKKILLAYKVDDFCTLTGIVPQEKGPSYLAACDILVASHVPNADGSAFFGSPTKLFEYMAMGKAIVASSLGQIGEVLKHNHSAWMATPGDVNSLMMGLKTLIDDPSTRARLGQNARQEAVSRYTWREHTRKIIDALLQLS